MYMHTRRSTALSVGRLGAYGLRPESSSGDPLVFQDKCWSLGSSRAAARNLRLRLMVFTGRGPNSTNSLGSMSHGHGPKAPRARLFDKVVDGSSRATARNLLLY